MEPLRKMPSLVIYLTFLVLAPQLSREADAAVTKLNEDNWTLMLENEWIVEFMAPWCPACVGMQKSWESLGAQARDLGIHVAEVDVTTSPGLSGRFIVTALPTIYHVMNGEFRQYKGPRSLESLVNFIEDSKWKATDPVPWYKEPTRLHMSVVSQFFRLSQLLRTVHNELLVTYGLPTYGSYLIFAVVTIILGSFLGLILVCMIDFICPPKASGEKRPYTTTNPSEAPVNDDLVDEEEERKNDASGDGVDEVDSDDEAERHSQSDTQSSDSESTTQRETLKNSTKEKTGDSQSSPDIRKRKPRKAD